MSQSDLAISIRGLSKSYTIAHGGLKKPSFREVCMDRLRNPFHKPQTETFWALKDVSFDVKKGEVVGIIGRNGAGKSTLLKILSRITEPTGGEIDVYGRIGSLLEVGTGFHPELTGRENIYLNGSILGMTRAEIARQFDAIVDFSEIEKFLDTPVKRYSSGMYVRLAFAVAAHLNPEILIVDEVLAVGDAEFQKKCLGKMSDVAANGRTVLFVSHSMAAVQRLCSLAVWLDAGQMEIMGATESVVEHYLEASHRAQSDDAADLEPFRPTGAQPTITSARILNEAGTSVTGVTLGSDIRFEMTFDVLDGTPFSNPVMGVVVHHSSYGTVGGVNMDMTGTQIFNGPHFRGTLSCTLQRPPLLPGHYRVDLWLTDGTAFVDRLEGYLSFSVAEADIYASGRGPYSRLGVIYLDAIWGWNPQCPTKSGLNKRHYAET